MFKSLVVIVLLAVGALSLALTTATPSSQDSDIVGLYRNTTEGFSIILPDGWVGQELENTFPLLSVNGEEQGEAVNAQVWIFPAWGKRHGAVLDG